MSKKLDRTSLCPRHGLNTIRLEGRIDRDEFFEKTDKLGILVMPLDLCDTWERWKRWTPETHASLKHPWPIRRDGFASASVSSGSTAATDRRQRCRANVSRRSEEANAEPAYLPQQYATKLTGNSGVK